jgi:hypothetical protein
MSIVETLSPPERRAVDIVAAMIRLYGGLKGTGLFSGTTRYQALEYRLRLAAERSESVRDCWDWLARKMLWPLPRAQHDAGILGLITPRDDDGDVLRVLAENTGSTIAIARHLLRRERGADVDADDTTAPMVPSDSAAGLAFDLFGECDQ